MHWFIWIFYLDLFFLKVGKEMKGRKYALGFTSFPRHHFTFEATLKILFLASMQFYSNQRSIRVCLLNCALKANAISEGQHLLGSQTLPHADDVRWCQGQNEVLSMNATLSANCTAANKKKSYKILKYKTNLTQTRTGDLGYCALLQRTTLCLPRFFSDVGLNARTLVSE